mgnify:CR=1 FL=1
MPEWKTVRVKQELVAAAENTLKKERYRNLSEFVSEAIQLRLEELKRNTTALHTKTHLGSSDSPRNRQNRNDQLLRGTTQRDS